MVHPLVEGEEIDVPEARVFAGPPHLRLDVGERIVVPYSVREEGKEENHGRDTARAGKSPEVAERLPRLQPSVVPVAVQPVEVVLVPAGRPGVERPPEDQAAERRAVVEERGDGPFRLLEGDVAAFLPEAVQVSAPGAMPILRVVHAVAEDHEIGFEPVGLPHDEPHLLGRRPPAPAHVDYLVDGALVAPEAVEVELELLRIAVLESDLLGGGEGVPGHQYPEDYFAFLDRVFVVVVAERVERHLGGPEKGEFGARLFPFRDEARRHLRGADAEGDADAEGGEPGGRSSSPGLRPRIHSGSGLDERTAGRRDRRRAAIVGFGWVSISGSE